MFFKYSLLYLLIKNFVSILTTTTNRRFYAVFFIVLTIGNLALCSFNNTFFHRKKTKNIIYMIIISIIQLDYQRNKNKIYDDDH